MNLQANAETQTNNFILSANFGIVLEDFSRSIAGRFQSGGQPIFAIINCVDGSPTHEQYELLYSQSGYGSLDSPINLFRAAIDRVEQGTLDPLDGVDLGGGFFFSEWYGIYNPVFSPWLFHIEHGFQYIFPVGPGEAFFFDLATNDFWWSLSSFEGFTFYSFSRGTFNFDFAGTSNPRQFVDLQTGEFWSAP